ncbi:hypothetical protein Tco_0920096 [Tanacetum coccineum]
MLVERKYPLSKELLQRMLDFGLEVEVESTAALDLIRVLNSPCFMVKSWLVQDQTVLGKDYSNLLIADSLLKTIWFINAPCYGNEALASPKANVLAHAPIYNAILDKYEESLELGKNGSAFIQGKMPKKIKDPKLFTLPCRLGDSKPFDTLADLGTCVNLIPLYVFKKLKIGLLEETDHVFGLVDGTKSYPVGIVKIVEEKESYETRPSADGIGARLPYYAKKDFMDYQLSGEWEIARDAKLNPFKDVLVFINMVEFLGAIPINLKGNMRESDESIEKRIDWNRPPKEGD